MKIIWVRHTSYVLFLTSLIAIVVLTRGGRVDASTNDETPPVISNVLINSVDDTKASVSWDTDELSDSIINYGLNKNYGIVRDPLPDKVKHTLDIDQLDPSTTYFFRILSSDESGNQSISAGFKFTTRGILDIPEINQVQDPEQKALVEKAYAVIDKIVDPNALKVVQDKIQQQAQGVTNDLTIIGTPDVEPQTTTATISWTTDRESDSFVKFAKEDEYEPASPNPYTSSQGTTDDKTKNHTVEVVGLEPFTKYHFIVSSKDSLAIVGKSVDTTFVTKAVLPDILNLELAKIEETSATLNWTTSVPSSGLIEYTDQDKNETKSLGSPTLSTEHSLRISDLTLGTSYSAVVIAENEGGDRVRSEPVTFVTVKDELPPVISAVTNESTLFPGSEARIQTLVGWETDEPSQCDFYYREGIAPGTEDKTFPRQDDSFRKKHVQVIVDFRPSTVYKFWVSCKDPSGNLAKSEDFVLITPEKEKSIIDIILENFQGTFGWVNQIGK